MVLEREKIMSMAVVKEEPVILKQEHKERVERDEERSNESPREVFSSSCPNELHETPQ